MSRTLQATNDNRRYVQCSSLVILPRNINKSTTLTASPATKQCTFGIPSTSGSIDYFTISDGATPTESYAANYTFNARLTSTATTRFGDNGTPMRYYENGTTGVTIAVATTQYTRYTQVISFTNTFPSVPTITVQMKTDFGNGNNAFVCASDLASTTGFTLVYYNVLNNGYSGGFSVIWEAVCT